MPDSALHGATCGPTLVSTLDTVVFSASQALTEIPSLPPTASQAGQIAYAKAMVESPILRTLSTANRNQQTLTTITQMILGYPRKAEQI